MALEILLTIAALFGLCIGALGFYETIRTEPERAGSWLAAIGIMLVVILIATGNAD